ncbi:IS3 family transposase [Ectobacillus antri]
MERDYVRCFNHIRIQGTLDCMSPMEYKRTRLNKTF